MDEQQFNIFNSEGHLICSSCGCPESSFKPAYDEKGGLAGMTICTFGLWEPSLDDCAYASPEAGPTFLDALQRYR